MNPDGATAPKRPRSSGLVSASEIASWAWCPESWRLERGLGKEAVNQAALRKGDRFHKATATVEQRTRATLSLGLVLLAIAALFAMVLYLFGMRP